MRKVKLAFWLILLGLLGLVFWQNQTFFLEKRGIEVDYVVGHYQSPDFQIALYFLIFFLVGLLISYFSSLSERFVARKTIKKLNDELANAGIKISEMEAAMHANKPIEANSGSDEATEPTKHSESTTV